MRLKHFPTGLLRCGISKRKAKLFVTALIVAATSHTCFAQTSGTEPSGREGVQPTAAWTGCAPSDANGKTVYLYNVGTKQFLGKGGRWGTEATMNVEGVPFTLAYSGGTFTLTSQVKQHGGTSNGKLTLMDGVNSAFDKGTYFVDRTDGSSFTATPHGTGYVITSIDTYVGENGKKSDMYGKTYKVVASGAYQKAYAKLSTEDLVSDSTAYATWIIVTETERKDAFKKVNNAHEAAVNATFLMSDFDFARHDNTCSAWKTGATATGTTTETLTFGNDKVRTPEFATAKTVTVYTYTSDKHAYDKTIWGSSKHTSTIQILEDRGESFESMCERSSEHGTDYPTTVTYTKTNTEEKTVSGYTYYLGNGYDEAHHGADAITGEAMGGNAQAPYGGAWTANIHGPRGSVVQTIPNANMIKEGWYRVSCVGFTTATKGIARLFAAAGTGNASGSTAQSEKFGIADLAKIDAASKPATYVDASNLLATPG